MQKSKKKLKLILKNTNRKRKKKENMAYYEPNDPSDEIKITQVIIEFDNKKDRNAAKFYMMSKLTKTGRKNMLGNDVYTLKGTFKTNFGLEQGVFTGFSFNPIDQDDITFFKKRSVYYHREYERRNGVSHRPPPNVTNENGLKIIVEMNAANEHRMERCLFQMICDAGVPFERQHGDMAKYRPYNKGSNSAYHALKKLYL